MQGAAGGSKRAVLLHGTCIDTTWGVFKSLKGSSTYFKDLENPSVETSGKIKHGEIIC